MTDFYEQGESLLGTFEHYLYLYHEDIPVWHEDTLRDLPFGDLEYKENLELRIGSKRVPLRVLPLS